MKKNPLSLAFGGFLAMAAGIGIGRFVYTPILPPMVEAVPLTKSAAGLIASANFVGYLAGALLASWPGLPGTRRFWLILGLATNALCLAAMGLTHSLALFMALRFSGRLSVMRRMPGAGSSTSRCCREDMGRLGQGMRGCSEP